MPGQLVTIATFDLPTKARIAQNLLEQAGIKSVVTDESVVTMDWLLGNAVGWVKLQVLDDDAEKAVSALEESLGTGDESVDEDALAAEAVASGKEDGEEPATATTVAPVSQSDESLLPTSERDVYARRLFLTSVFSIAFPPLWFYTIYLFLNAALGEGPISPQGRIDLFRGAAIMAAGLLVLFTLLMSYWALLG